MTNKEIVAKLKTELSELNAKILNLKIFLETDKFIRIGISDNKQARLLKEQLEAMEKYEKLLISRIAILTNYIEKKDI